MSDILKSNLLFAQEQFEKWRHRKVDHNEMYSWAVAQAQAASPFYIFTVNKNYADFFAKEWISQNDPYRLRAIVYRDFFSRAFERRPIDREFIFCVDTGDDAGNYEKFPVLTFQKKTTFDNILIPDLEMITSDFFADVFPDHIRFDHKACRATFAGSTTGGGLIDSKVLASNEMPRLRAARYFKDSINVDFRLTSITQCSSTDIEDSLRQEGFGGRLIDWQDTYASKFGISIDGNGAACSRPAILLKSRCAMIKYHSNNVLYYFSALKSGDHYLGVECEHQVEEIVANEILNPGLYAHVAENGRVFGEKFLNKQQILSYMAEVMQIYRSTFHV